MRTASSFLSSSLRRRLGSITEIEQWFGNDRFLNLKGSFPAVSFKSKDKDF
jgi:hypothetical protein